MFSSGEAALREDKPRLRWSELMNLAGLLTLARGPLALLFLGVADQPRIALPLYVFAVGTDVIDGIIARRTHTTSYTGLVIDSYMDKLLHAVVALSLVFYDRIPAWWLLPWFARDWAQLGMLPFMLPAYFRGEFSPRGANQWGKWTTVTLALAMALTLAGYANLARIPTALTGTLGLVAAGTYLRQMLEDRRARR